MGYNETEIVNHYTDQAIKFGNSPKSTMEEQVIREKELDAIVSSIKEYGMGDSNVLDLGCGNGYALEHMRKTLGKNNHLYGIDFTESLVQIAQSRNIDDCHIEKGDARKLNFESGFLDVVYTERCLINIMDWEEQKKALNEIHRVLGPNGIYVMIECFTDGMDNNNKARAEMGLGTIPPADHNFYFEKDKLQEHIQDKFEIINYPIEPNFLSTHYFAARVLHPLITKSEWVKNTEFVKFFGNMPAYGNYSPLQILTLRAK